MPFAITNTRTHALDPQFRELPVARVTLADQTGLTAVQNMGVANLQAVRVRIRAKSLGGTSPTVKFAVEVDDAAAMGSPEVVAMSGVFEPVTGAVSWQCDLVGWSDTGFQYVRIRPILTGTSPTVTYDAIIEAV